MRAQRFAAVPESLRGTDEEALRAEARKLSDDVKAKAEPATLMPCKDEPDAVPEMTGGMPLPALSPSDAAPPLQAPDPDQDPLDSLPAYKAGDDVEYHSNTHHVWLNAKILNVNSKGQVVISLKPNTWINKESQLKSLRPRGVTTADKALDARLPEEGAAEDPSQPSHAGEPLLDVPTIPTLQLENAVPPPVSEPPVEMKPPEPEPRKETQRDSSRRRKKTKSKRERSPQNGKVDVSPPPPMPTEIVSAPESSRIAAEPPPAPARGRQSSKRAPGMAMPEQETPVPHSEMRPAPAAPLTEAPPALPAAPALSAKSEVAQATPGEPIGLKSESVAVCTEALGAVSLNEAQTARTLALAAMHQKIVNVKLNLDRRTPKLVRHGAATQIHEILRQYGGNRKLAAKDATGFQIGQEVMLGQLAGTAATDLVELVLFEDDW